MFIFVTTNLGSENHAASPPRSDNRDIMANINDKESFLNHINGRNSFLKHLILENCVYDKQFTLSDLSREYDTSVPTASRIVTDLIDDGFVKEIGKMESSSGRKPVIYGLNPDAGNFVGVDVKRDHLSVAVTNFMGELCFFKESIKFTLTNTEESCRRMCDAVRDCLKSSKVDLSKIRSYGFIFSGRVNFNSGYCFSYFISEDKPIASILEKELGLPVYVENDSRAIAYAEYMSSESPEKTFLVFNVSWGLGLGMIIDGKLGYGRSGFSGEIGHFPIFDNKRICRCGKIGCLETEASGSALHRIVLEEMAAGQPSLLNKKFKAGEEITLNDILDAADAEDTVVIEAIEKVGNALGQAIAGMINLFNPGVIVIAGVLARAHKYLMTPIKGSVNKLALAIVSSDTSIIVTRLGEKAGAIGASYIAKVRMLGII